MFSIQVKDLRYRGFRVWRAVIDDLLTVRGMSKAQNVCSWLPAGNYHSVAAVQKKKNKKNTVMDG